jgi:hypothetical protein
MSVVENRHKNAHMRSRGRAAAGLIMCWDTPKARQDAPRDNAGALPNRCRGDGYTGPQSQQLTAHSCELIA